MSIPFCNRQSVLILLGKKPCWLRTDLGAQIKTLDRIVGSSPQIHKLKRFNPSFYFLNKTESYNSDDFCVQVITKENY